MNRDKDCVENCIQNETKSPFEAYDVRICDSGDAYAEPAVTERPLSSPESRKRSRGSSYTKNMRGEDIPPLSGPTLKGGDEKREYIANSKIPSAGWFQPCRYAYSYALAVPEE